jgi:hypothetical protein
MIKGQLMTNATQTTKKLATELRIDPQTRIGFGRGPWAFVVTETSRKAQTFIRYGEDAAFWTAAYDAANGINYALSGRTRDVTTLGVREMSAYRVLKLVAELMTAGVAMVDAPAWLDAKAAQEGWR